MALSLSVSDLAILEIPLSPTGIPSTQQRRSIASDVSSNSTSGIVSDRHHSDAERGSPQFPLPYDNEGDCRFRRGIVRSWTVDRAWHWGDIVDGIEFGIVEFVRV
jgi:hypothetical protein